MSKLGSNNETDSLEEFFSDRLKNESMQPSEQVWERIEGSLSQDKRKRRGFIWLFFSGLFFIGAGISTYVFMNHKNELTAFKTRDIKNQTTISATDKKTITETTKEETKSPTEPSVAIINTKKEITTTENTTNENVPKEEKTNTVKIQLGAFKKPIDKAIFDKTGLDIKQEINENGVTRYYAEVPENEKQTALQKVQQAGFTDAFVKQNTLLAAKDDESNTHSAQNNSRVLVVKNNEVKRETKNTTSASLNIAVPAKNITTPTTKNTKTDLPLANNSTILKNETAKNENENKQVPSNEAVSSNTNTVSAINKQPEETKTEAVAEKQNDIAAKTDSVIKTDTAIVSAINKTDSVKTEDKKKNEPVVDKVNKDSLPLVLTERWALLLTGGPNFFLKNTNSNLFNTSGETQPVTFNTSLKLEYKPFRKIAISVGLNYSYFTAQQDATQFYFNKNQTADFIFYSSYGPMAVGMSTMLQDFSPAAPVTMFHASYSYTSKLNTLQMPIEAKWYFVNGKRVNLFTTLGASGMFVISQQTNLSVIKEHLTNNLSYNQISTTKFNALLMLGLGCDIRLYKKLYFTVDGGFRYGAINLSNTAGIKTYPTYFSTNGGLKIKF